MLAMVSYSYSRHPPSGQITCYLNRTYHVLLTHCEELTCASRGGLQGGQNYGLIREHARTLIHRMRVAPLQQHVRLGAHDKEGRAERKDEEPLKVDVGPIHHVEGPSLRHNLVEDVHIMHGPAGDADKRGDVAVQIQQGMHLDGGLALAKLRPWKH